MSEVQKFTQQVRTLIDELKSVCANYGLGNDGNEFKIITQVFLYKFLHDKFVYAVKQTDEKIRQASDWEKQLAAYSEDKFELLALELGEGVAVFKPEQLIPFLFSRQNDANFAEAYLNLANTLKDHLDLEKKGYGHKKPKKGKSGMKYN